MGGPLHHRLRSGRLPEVEYTDFAQDLTNLDTYTFSGAAIGAASTDRLVAVVILADDGVAHDITSVTIGGNAATVLQDDPSSSNAIAYLAVPSGTTADVVVTLSGVKSACSIGVYALYNLNSATPLAHDSDDAILNFSLTTIRDGITIGGTNTAAVDWTGDAVVEDDDQGGLRFFHAINTGTSITLSSSAVSGYIIGASWR